MSPTTKEYVALLMIMSERHHASYASYTTYPQLITYAAFVENGRVAP